VDLTQRCALEGVVICLMRAIKILKHAKNQYQKCLNPTDKKNLENKNSRNKPPFSERYASFGASHSL